MCQALIRSGMEYYGTVKYEGDGHTCQTKGTPASLSELPLGLQTFLKSFASSMQILHSHQLDCSSPAPLPDPVQDPPEHLTIYIPDMMGIRHRDQNKAKSHRRNNSATRLGFCC